MTNPLPSDRPPKSSDDFGPSVPPLDDTGQTPHWTPSLSEDGTDIVLSVGQRPLPDYELVQLLGRGGFGEVWKAVGPGGFHVALKFIRLGEQKSSVELRALELMKGIRHAHLLAMFGAWQCKDCLVVALELADRTLLDRLQEVNQRQDLPGIPGSELLEYMQEAAKGIDYLNDHRHPSPSGGLAGIQHKDIKPQNLLLVGGTVKVADFGLAKILERTVDKVSGGLTPSYAAPEFFAGEAARWSDQYSLAVTYCQLRGGRLPFTGAAAKVMAGHLSQPPDLSMIPEDERPVVARALSKKPEERWPTCRAFVEALAPYLAGQRSTVPDGGPRRQPRGESEPGLASRGRRPSRLAVLIALLLVLPMPLLLFWPREDEKIGDILPQQPRAESPEAVKEKPKEKPARIPPVAGTKEPDVVIPRLTKVQEKVLVEGNSEFPYIWIAYEGYLPLKEPDGEEPSGAKPLSFLKPCVYASVYQGSRGTYFLLVECDNTDKVTRRLGWVDKRYVVRPDALRDPATKIHRKGLIVNTLASIKAGHPIEKVPILLAPQEKARDARDPFRLSNFYFLYADTDPSRPEEGYLLLGTVPHFNENEALARPKQLSELVLGWVHKSCVCQWNTREGLEWDVPSTVEGQPGAPKRRTTPGRVYASYEDARKGLRGEPAKILFEEVFDKDGVSKPFRPDQLRYPIVPLNVGRNQSATSLSLDENTLRRVGIVGGFGNNKGQTILAATEIEQLQRRLDVLDAKIDTVELLFVIDDTGSMDKWFDTVAASVEAIIEALKGSRRVRLAISYYNDTSDEKDLDKAVIWRKLVDASSQEAREMVAELKRHKSANGGDPREQMFHGIKKSVQEAGFQPNASKIVIVVGDDGNKSDENDPKQEAEKAVRDALLKETETPIDFFAIQVKDPDKDSDSRAFRKQAKSIVSLVQEELVSRYKVSQAEAEERGGYVPTEDKEVIQKKIKEQFENLRKKGSELRLGIGRARRGEWTQLSPELLKILENNGIDIEKFGRARRGEWTHISPELHKILEDNGIHIEKYSRTLGLQLLQYGYLWDRTADGLPQTRVRLLVTDAELEFMIEMLGKLDSKDPGRLVSEKDLITRMVQTQAGERQGDLRPQDWSFENVILKPKGLTARSFLLRRAVREIEDGINTVNERQKVLMKKKKLEDIRANREYDYRPREVGEAFKITVWDRVGEGRPSQRLFSMGTDRSIKWCWVDFEEEWP